MAVEGQDAGTASLRDTLEAAVTAVEEQSSAPAEGSQQAAPAPAPAEGEGAPEGQVVDLNKEGEAAKLEGAKPAIEPAPQPPADEAPKSWKASARGKWATVDAEIKSEVQRREREVSKVFGETANIREQAKQFEAAWRPFEARIVSTGLTPMRAMQELFRADHILSSAPGPQRAQYMAQLIKDYGIDIRALDAALAGEQVEDPVTSQFTKLLDERLSPLHAFMAQQQQLAQQQDQRLQTDAATTIDAMAADNVKYPHFEAVRADMADVIELNVRRNVFLTPEQAYTRAVAMNPELGAQAALQANNGRQLQQAQAINARAQRALNASSSVSGAPGGSPVTGVNANSSLRDTIEAAFDQVSGR